MNKEQIYHNSRTTFAIINDTIKIGPVGLSHADWLIGRLLLTENEFNSIVRGYYTDTEIYFYQGAFETNKLVESTARKFADRINRNASVFCGCIKGEVGEKWKPIKQLR